MSGIIIQTPALNGRQEELPSASPIHPVTPQDIAPSTAMVSITQETCYSQPLRVESTYPAQTQPRSGGQYYAPEVF